MAETESEVFAPEKLGEYTILQDIAEGTFGIVKMARHTVTGQIVAMKFISKALIHRTKTKLRVQREVEYMRALRHPHIVKLYEVISTPTDIIIVLEYAGGELFRYIVQNGRMPEAQARRFFQQLMSGIEYSHKLKIVHRDLKPENVLLDNDLNVKIADFGLSNEIKDGDFLKTSCGSPNYAAPEVIRGGLYTGPEIDVWSAGVILYVMLCGSLPFEDDNVKMLFSKISHGVFHIPPSLSPDARSLITSMLVVDPVKRITVADITQHPFFKTDLPRYLTPLPPPPGPVLPTLSALVKPPKALDFQIIEGLGRIEEDVVDELTSRMDGVDKDDVWEALRRDDGAQGNAVKVAYLLLRDKRRLGQDLSIFEEQERDAQLAAMDPRNAVSPNAISPGGGDLETNPFESEFNNQYADGEEEDDAEDAGSDDSLDFNTHFDLYNNNNFAVLNSSLPVGQEQHNSGTSLWGAKHRARKQAVPRSKWHHGIRSRSPPMEVMLEIYRTLKALGMEWKEKKDLGGLGGVGPNDKEWNGEMDNKAAAGIFFVETRTRIQDVVVLMNLQLYQVDSSNYLVDFHHKKTYRASTEPGAGKYDMAVPAILEGPSSPDFATSPPVSPKLDLNVRHGKSIDQTWVGAGEDDAVSPFVFMDVACRLILELAGGGQ